ncbi:MAG: alpha-ribazole phosphatase [Tepidanaerobacteraceae bacterium]
MARFFLVRHGETIWNRERKYQGQSDVPLTDEGRIQARSLSERLKDEKIDVIYASDLGRTIETAEIISEHHGLEVVPASLMRELSFGIWEGMTYDEIIQKWAKEYNKWQDDPYNEKPPEGETLSELCERISKFLMKAAQDHPDGRILVVSHAGPIRAILSVLLNLKQDFFWKFKISNTSLTIIEYDGLKQLSDSDAFIVTVNDTHHLKQI